MNSRRSFFKQLALLGTAAITVPSIFIPKFGSIKWKGVGVGWQGWQYTSYEVKQPPWIEFEAAITNLDIVTDPDTGLSLAVRKIWGINGEETHVEIVPGMVEGQPSALKRLIEG